MRWRRDTARPETAGMRRRRRRFVATAVLAATIGGGVVTLTPATASAAGTTYTAYPTGAFLAHLNGLRASHGLAPLAVAGDLSSVAYSHSVAMAQRGTIFHNSITTAISNWQTVGENVGMGPTESAIDTAFDHSPDHYANEVNTSYTQVGIGAVKDSRGEIFVTLDFRRPMNATPPPAVHPAPPATGGAVSGPSRSTSTASTPAHAPTAADNAAAAAAAAKAQAAAAAKAAAANAAAAAAQQRAALAAENARLSRLDDPLAQALKFRSAVAGLDG